MNISTLRGAGQRELARAIIAACAIGVASLVVPIPPASARTAPRPLPHPAGHTVGAPAGFVDWAPAPAPASPPAPTSTAAASATPVITFQIDVGSWTAGERATLRSWTAAGSLQLKALRQVVGPPGRDLTVTIVKAATGDFAGTYDAGTDTVTMAGLNLDVFMHELNHAVHDDWIISNAVWEEGMARGAEVAEMNLLAAWGVAEAQSYWNLHHMYSYDVYYENANVPDVGVANGSLFGLGETALALLRYEQAGYAFGKILLESPLFIKRFNATLFQQASGSLPESTLVSLAATARSTVEGRTFPVWYSRQHIFDTSPPGGCRLFQKVSQFNVDFFCRSPQGFEAPQSGARVTLSIFSSAGTLLHQSEAVTSALGVAQFFPAFGPYHGRLRLVSSVVTPTRTIKSTFYRSSDEQDGIFGVVRNATAGTVSFSSPRGAFPPVTVPVVRGAFSASGLGAAAGPVTVTFTGEGKQAHRRVNKDASPYSLVIEAA